MKAKNIFANNLRPLDDDDEYIYLIFRVSIWRWLNDIERVERERERERGVTKTQFYIHGRLPKYPSFSSSVLQSLLCSWNGAAFYVKLSSFAYYSVS